MGVVQVLDKASGAPFTDDDVVLTKLAGAQVTSVLRNRQEYAAATRAHKQATAELSSLQKRVRRDSVTSMSLADHVTKQRVLLNFAALAASANDHSSLVSLVYKDAAGVLEATAAALYVLDGSTGRLRAITSSDDVTEPGLGLGEGLAGYVAAHHNPVQWSATSTVASPELHPTEVQHLGVRPVFVLAVPIRDQTGDVVGVLQVRSTPHVALTVVVVYPVLFEGCPWAWWAWVQLRRRNHSAGPGGVHPSRV